MLEMLHVDKSYADTPVLQDICLRVGPAESLIVLGGSGSGKSTLLRLFIGLERCDAGQVNVRDVDISRLKEDELIAIRDQMGIVFQEGALFDSLTIRQNVGYRLYDEGGWDEHEIEEIVTRLLGFVGLTHTIDMKPAELSGGMRRRVAIARALAGQPRYMLYDEPTAGLDPVTARSICDLLVKLRDMEGMTSVVVTHDLNAAYFLAEHTARVVSPGDIRVEREPADQCFIHTSFSVLRDGRIVFSGNMDELVSSGDPYIQEFIS